MRPLQQVRRRGRRRAQSASARRFRAQSAGVSKIQARPISSCHFPLLLESCLSGCTRELGSSQKCPQNTWKLLGRNSSSAQLEDGSRAFLPQRSFPSPSQRRQLDNFNYFDDGGIADRRCGPSAGPRPPRQCAKLTSQSSRQKRSGAGSPSNVWGKGSSSLLHLLSDCMQVD